MIPYSITKFTHPRGCGKSTGWDGAHLDGFHPCGHPMRVSFSRVMDQPEFVRWSSTIDGSQHESGQMDNIGKAPGDDQSLIL